MLATGHSRTAGAIMALVRLRKGGGAMCVTCGCGQLEENHGDPRNITLSQFREAAQAAGVDMQQLQRNIQQGLQQAQQR
jgi:hypothetical protein